MNFPLIRPLIDNSFYNCILQLIHSSQKEIYIVSFEFDIGFPSSSSPMYNIFQALSEKAPSLDTITIFLNKSNRSNRNYYINQSSAQALSKNGIIVYQANSVHTVHSKLFISDYENLVIGSHNFTNRSIKRNSEFSLYFQSNIVYNIVKSYILDLIREKGVKV